MQFKCASLGRSGCWLTLCFGCVQAKANRGILYVDEVNLLDDGLVDVVLDSAASGVNTVEREGISIAHPANVPPICQYRTTSLAGLSPTYGTRCLRHRQWRARGALAKQSAVVASISVCLTIIHHCGMNDAERERLRF